MPITAAKQSAESQELAGFDCMMREHQQRIYRFLFAMLRDQDAASTLTQECFLRAFKGWKSFRGDSSVATWLTRIAVNLARDHHRNRKLAFWRRLFTVQPGEDVTVMAEAQPELRADPERSVLAKEKASEVWEIVGKLPTQQRAIFTLRFAEEMSIEEIAQAMSLQQGTVKTHLFRALATLRKASR
ncbi:MAG: polymerase sigma-70 factor [Acidobacteriaceae bacterium]|nr:polymerase sigma-70 factor [Acidobacteriaceae bacterium]